MDVVINGQPRRFPDLAPAARLADLIRALALNGDRIAVERNGEIVRRPEWEATPIANGDRFEIVHFVGGGLQGKWSGRLEALERQTGAAASDRRQ